MARGAPVIFHMLFTDDGYVYGKTMVEEASKFLQLLQCFEKASVQKINLLKSSIFFGSNTSGDVRQQVCEVLQIQEVEEDSLY